MNANIKNFINTVGDRNPNEPEFLQAVTEVAETVLPFIEKNPQYGKDKLLERMTEPERVLLFRVPWVDDSGEDTNKQRI